MPHSPYTINVSERALFLYCIAVAVYAGVVTADYWLASALDAREEVLNIWLGALILIGPALAPIVTLGSGRFRFRITAYTALNALYWFGFLIALIVGVERIIAGLLSL